MCSCCLTAQKMDTTQRLVVIIQRKGRYKSFGKTGAFCSVLFTTSATLPRWTNPLPATTAKSAATSQAITSPFLMCFFTASFTLPIPNSFPPSPTPLIKREKDQMSMKPAYNAPFTQEPESFLGVSVSVQSSIRDDLSFLLKVSISRRSWNKELKASLYHMLTCKCVYTVHVVLVQAKEIKIIKQFLVSYEKIAIFLKSIFKEECLCFCWSSRKSAYLSSRNPEYQWFYVMSEPYICHSETWRWG